MSKKTKESEVITLKNGGTYVNVKTLIDYLNDNQEKLNCEKPPQNETYEAGYYDGLQFIVNKLIGILDEYKEEK